MKRLHVPPARVEALGAYARDPAFDAADRAALALADAITRDPTGVSEEVWSAVACHFDEGQILELLAVIGLFNAFNRINNALQTEVTR